MLTGHEGFVAGAPVCVTNPWFVGFPQLLALGRSKIAFYASPAARNSAFPICSFPVRSTLLNGPGMKKFGKHYFRLTSFSPDIILSG